jgi:glyoxylase-like metal-dependent hydrolase (beta-lactamase superfamily II)
MGNFKKGDGVKHVCNAVLLCGIAFLWIPAANAQDVSIRRVTDRVITLSMSNLSMHTNITVIETQKGLVCIETEFVPSVMKTIKKAAEKKLGRNDWAYVINTHGHLHHARGNIAFPDTPIIGYSKTMMDRFKARLSSQEGRRAYCDYAGVTYGIKVLRMSLSQAKLTAEQKKILQRRLSFCYAIRKEIMGGFEVRNPTIAFHKGQELDLGDTHLRLYYWGDGINHSSIFVHVVEDNMLVGMGMGQEGWIPGFFGKVTLEGIRHSISVYEKLCDKNFPIDVMIGIHKPELNRSRQSFQYSRAYLQSLLDNLTQAQQDGLSLEQAKKKFPYDKEPAAMRRFFYQPDHVSEIHLKNIDTIWELLQKEESSSSQEQNNMKATDIFPYDNLTQGIASAFILSVIFIF